MAGASTSIGIADAQFRRFEFTDEKSSKFWQIRITAEGTEVRYGKIGTAGQSQVKPFETPDLAQKSADKLVAAKLIKGYSEVVPAESVTKSQSKKIKAAVVQALSNSEKTVCKMRPDLITVETKISSKGQRQLRYLSEVRSRLVGLRESIDTALQSRGLPNNIDAIQNALIALDSGNGKLELPHLITPLELVLIWGNPQAQWITSITLKGLEMKFNPDDFKIPRERFFDMYGTDCPDGFLKTYDLFSKIDKFIGENSVLDSISFNNFGLSCYLFRENDPPPNALILHKYGHHELNYVPYAAYGSDAVTYGLMYDYYQRAFFTTVYHGDGDVSPYNNPLEPVIDKICNSASIDELGQYYNRMDDDELINILTNPEYLEYGHDELKFHTISYFVGNFFVENPTLKYTIPVNDKGRYAKFFGAKEREELQRKFPSSYLFSETFPVTPIALDRFGGADKIAINNFVEFVTCTVKLHREINKKNRLSEYFSDEYYQELRAFLIKKSSSLMLKCDDLSAYLINTKKYKKKDRIALFTLLDNVIRNINSLALDLIRTGVDGYGFVVAMIFWSNCMDGELSKFSSNLLNSLSESACPSFIKKTAALHSVCRHDSSIPT